MQLFLTYIKYYYTKLKIGKGCITSEIKYLVGEIYYRGRCGKGWGKYLYFLKI
ncbi:hypothetical protein VPHK460_0165 [Vibrio phage K460]